VTVNRAATSRRQLVLVLVGIALFVAASAACAFAPSIDALIAFRLLQGLGGCAGIVIARAIVRDLFQGVEAAHLCRSGRLRGRLHGRRGRDRLFDSVARRPGGMTAAARRLSSPMPMAITPSAPDVRATSTISEPTPSGAAAQSGRSVWQTPQAA
jgi:hypothetical protein